MADEIKPDSPPSTETPKVAPPKPPASVAPKKPAAKAPPEPPSGPTDPEPPEDLEIPGYVQALQAGVPGAVNQVTYWVGDWSVIVSADRLLEVMNFLRNDAATDFDYCSDITATDWPPRQQRFDVIYCLYSTRLRHRLRVKVRAAEGEAVSSVTGIWAGANWLEREVYDQFGVNIVNHPDLRRILMPDEWQGHPQRKDYPLEGPGEFLMEDPQDWLSLWNLPDEAGEADIE
tara:strand:+ start:1981 stop:2673 length:693 start_codon:yes stop_codon:yes gene_type:complete